MSGSTDKESGRFLISSRLQLFALARVQGRPLTLDKRLYLLHTDAVHRAFVPKDRLSKSVDTEEEAASSDLRWRASRVVFTPAQ